MVIATYRVATIPHDWHTIVRSRSSKVIDFNVIWKPVFDFLLVINSNLGLILHRLATIHPLQRTTDDDGRQPCKTPTALLSSGALWLEPAFPAWRNHTGWSVTTATPSASGLTVWHCCHGTLGAAPLRTSQWLKLWKTLICSRVPSPKLVLLKENQVQLTQRHPRLSFQRHWKHLDPWVSAPRSSWHKSEGVWPRWRQTPVKQRSFSSACRSPSTRHA